MQILLSMQATGIGKWHLMSENFNIDKGKSSLLRNEVQIKNRAKCLLKRMKNIKGVDLTQPNSPENI